MCTTIGFSYKNGQVFGRTLELGMVLENKVLFVPKGYQIVETDTQTYESIYNTLGSGFFEIVSFGDGINEAGLMGSNNFFPGYASFSKEKEVGMINTTTSHAFDFLLTRCKSIEEVREEAKKINLVKKILDQESSANHFFFMDTDGNKLVLEPKDGKLVAYDNPYGVLTNAPDFPWHQINLKNFINLKPENTKEAYINGTKVTQFGEGTGMLGLPGDFTPPSRFVRAAYYVSNTDKNLDRHAAILQGFRILSQFDIPKGAIIDPIEKHKDETLYTSIFDTKKSSYHVKCHTNINIQSFYLEDFKNDTQVKFIELAKTMDI